MAATGDADEITITPARSSHGLIGISTAPLMTGFIEYHLNWKAMFSKARPITFIQFYDRVSVVESLDHDISFIRLLLTADLVVRKLQTVLPNSNIHMIMPNQTHMIEEDKIELWDNALDHNIRPFVPFNTSETGFLSQWIDAHEPSWQEDGFLRYFSMVAQRNSDGHQAVAAVLKISDADRLVQTWASFK